MTLTLQRASEPDLPAMHAILSVCGEHMHRTQNLDHWYPFRPLETYRTEIRSADVYAIYDDSSLVGTFYVTSIMREWYAPIQWTNPDHRALYLGGFGVLPLAQGRGVGRWAMAQIDALAQSGEYDALRFDGVLENEPLMRFYDQLGYTRIGLLSKPTGTHVTIFERVFV